MKRLLEIGDKILTKDEVFDFETKEWVPMFLDLVGKTYSKDKTPSIVNNPVRRNLKDEECLAMVTYYTKEFSDMFNLQVWPSGGIALADHNINELIIMESLPEGLKKLKKSVEDYKRNNNLKNS